MLNKIKSLFASGPKTAITITLVVLIWMLFGVFKTNENHVDKVEIKDSNALNEVLVSEIHAQKIHRHISVLGETRYSRKVVITALTNGTVIRISGKEGKLVSKNRDIIQLDNREALAKFQHAQSLNDKQTLELDGYQKLFEQELISNARLAEAKAQLAGAKADMIQAQIHLESTSVKPPFDGVLQKILVEEGDYVRAGQEIAEILDFSPFIITGEVSEKEAIYVTQGQNADASLIDGTIFHGTISYKSSQADTKTRSFTIELKIPNTENNTILSGISSTIIIPVTHDRAHLVSTSTLEIDEQGNFGVKLINQDNLVSFQTIEVLQSSSEGVWVAGLPDTAYVITRGQGFVKSGDIVKAVFEKTPQKKQARNQNPQTSPDTDIN